MTSRREHTYPCKTCKTKEIGAKTEVLVGLDLSSAGGGTEAGVQFHIREIVRGETFKAESETDDLWQPKWNKNQTVLATAIQMQAGTQVSWKGQWLQAGV